ncbi:hypothetical protein J0H58_31305, partial [bacterium]|nr:hypothetical protein [bacterium]
MLGLVSQVLHVRERVPKGERVAARRARVSREPRLWERGIDEIGPTPAGCQWVDVCDRGADAFEFLQVLVSRGRRFLVRSTHNRALGVGPPLVKAAELLRDLTRGRPATAGRE